MAADHCALIQLNEPCILENTRLRYMQDEIYTYTGKILVALNPFGPLKIYGCATRLVSNGSSDPGCSSWTRAAVRPAPTASWTHDPHRPPAAPARREAEMAQYLDNPP